MHLNYEDNLDDLDKHTLVTLTKNDDRHRLINGQTGKNFYEMNVQKEGNLLFIHMLQDSKTPVVIGKSHQNALSLRTTLRKVDLTTGRIEKFGPLFEGVFLHSIVSAVMEKNIRDSVYDGSQSKLLHITQDGTIHVGTRNADFLVKIEKEVEPTLIVNVLGKDEEFLRVLTTAKKICAIYRDGCHNYSIKQIESTGYATVGKLVGSENGAHISRLSHIQWSFSSLVRVG